MLLTMDKYKLSLIQEKHRRVELQFPWYGLQHGTPGKLLCAKHPGRLVSNLLRANVIDEVGEYLIFSGTEEWSRLLFSIGEAPSE